MVYRRKSYARRRGRGRRRSTPWYNRKYNAMQLAAKAARGVWYLKGLVNSEMFKYDIPIPNTAIDATTGLVYNCQTMSQGDNYGGRTGNSILARGLLCRLRIQKASSPTTTYVRMYVIQDNQQIGDTLPTFAELLHSVDVDAPINPLTTGRFKILTSKMILLTGDKPGWHTEKFYNLRHHIRFNGTGSGDVQKGGIYVMLLSDQSTVANQPTIDGHLRMHYHDN